MIDLARLGRATCGFLLAGIVFAAAGCGGGRAAMEGTVTLDDTPVDGGVLTLFPDKGTAKGDLGHAEIVNGKYSLSKGPPPGNYRVEIVWYKKTGKQVVGSEPPSTPTAIFQSVIPSYICPSDKVGTINPNFKNYGKNNYVCNRWVLGPDGNSLPAAYTIQGIPDGSSNTLMVGERDLVTNVSGVWIRHDNTSASFEGRVGRGINPRPAPGKVFTTGSEQRLAFSSQHTSGSNFVFADGSVHFVAEATPADLNDAYTNFPGVNSVNYILQRLQIPNDGKPLGAEF